MAKKSINDIKIPTFDDLFTTEEQRQEAKAEKIVKLNIEEISDFKNHPFSVVRKTNDDFDNKYDSDMASLIDSIKEHGQLMPVIVRPKKEGNGYEMISGHRRKFALQDIGKKEIDAIVRNLDDDQATILMVDSNLAREDILPVEKGKAYSMRLEAMKHQGKVIEDLTCGQLGDKLSYRKKSIEKLSDHVGESRRQIQRYIRLIYLIPPLQEMINGTHDTFKISFLPAVELSFLKENEQSWLTKAIYSCGKTPSLAQAQELKKRSQNGELDEKFISTYLETKKPNQREKKVLNKDYDKYFPKGYTEEQKNEVIIKLLKNWQKSREHKER